MNTKRKIEELGAHYKVARGTWNYRQWADAIKRASGTHDESIEVMWDDLQKAKQTPTEHVVGNSALVAGAAPAGEPDVAVIPPSDVSVMPEHSRTVAVHVHAPQAVQAQVVEYPPRDWLGFATRLAGGCQTLALGLVVGVLVSKPVLKFLGY